MDSINTIKAEIGKLAKSIHILLILAIISVLVNPFYVDCATTGVKNYSLLSDKELILPIFSEKTNLSEYIPVVLSESKLALVNEQKALLSDNSEDNLILNTAEKQYITKKTTVVRLAMNDNSPIALSDAEKEALAEEQDMRLWVLNEVKKAGLNIKEAETIINCESQWHPDAIGVNKNGTYDVGLWQINSIHKNMTNADKMDYKEATKWAIEKRLRDGSWDAWSCSRKLR
jgi:hypothetical protein